MEKIIFVIILIILLIVIFRKKVISNSFTKTIIFNDENKLNLLKEKRVIRILKKNGLNDLSDEEIKRKICEDLKDSGFDLEKINNEQLNESNLSAILKSQNDLGKGDINVVRSVKKVVTTYSNGEKVSEEQTLTTDKFDKKAITECPNCGASLDLQQDLCSYCRTKIN